MTHFKSVTHLSAAYAKASQTESSPLDRGKVRLDGEMRLNSFNANPSFMVQAIASGSSLRMLIKRTVLLAAAFSQFSIVLFSNAAMAQAVSQTVAPTALPTGGVVRAGAAAISQGGAPANPNLTINQTTNRAAIDWNTFNIGSSAGVTFVVPDAQSSTLNRVLDTNASQIFGSLSSNGQVFLLNPNGVVFGASASVNRGDGGKVVLWSTDWTGFYGSIKATGGTTGGNGGMVETSSHNNLQAFGSVDTAASQGRFGQWLLDPTDVTIVASGGPVNGTFTGGTFTSAGTGSAQISASSINTALTSGNVTINTASADSQTGNITVSSAISKSGSMPTTLTMNAAGSIVVGADISSSSGALTINLNAAGGSVSGSGNITSQGGLVTFSMTANGTSSGVYSGNIYGISSTFKVTGGGTLYLTGTSYSSTATIDPNTTLYVGNNGAVGNLNASTINNSGTLGYLLTTSQNIAATMTGTGNLAVGGVDSTGAAGSTDLTLTNNSLSGAATIYSGSTLRIGDNGSTTSAFNMASIDNRGSLVFSTITNQTISTVISGAGIPTRLRAVTAITT